MANWKDVKGYEGLYLVSDEGEVYSLPRIVNNGRGTYVTGGRLLKPGKRAQYYSFVILSDGENIEHKSLHRLVAEAFIPNPNDYPEVNHIDENTDNNAANNLEWCTRQYNIDYSKSKKVSQWTMDGEKVAEYKSIAFASQISGINRTAINNALVGWSKTAGGYIWKYETEDK